MKQSVYVETSVISYLAARPSRDIITLANQEITRDWWQNDAGKYDCCVSAMVQAEAQEGDIEAAAGRMALVNSLPFLAITSEVEQVASLLLQQSSLPQKAERDAIHIACASVHSIDFLITWNMKHIANAIIRVYLEKLLASLGRHVPIICTPYELLSAPEGLTSEP